MIAVLWAEPEMPEPVAVVDAVDLERMRAALNAWPRTAGGVIVAPVPVEKRDLRTKWRMFTPYRKD